MIGAARRAAVVAVALALAAAGRADAGVAEDVIARANRLRAEAGLAPVAAEPRLAAAAAAFAQYMARTDRYAHDADGREPAERVQAAGYDWCVVAENIAWEYDSRGLDDAALSQRLFDAWRLSPPHRRNLLDADVIQTGVASAQSVRTGRYYGVQLFARPPPCKPR